MPDIKLLNGVATLAAEYENFILDIWGVIHDGQDPYPQVKECLEALKQHGKKVMFLSNAPRRAETVAIALRRMGIDNTLYDGIVTSGEVFWQSLAHPEKGFFKPKGKHYVYMGLERDRTILDGLHYEETPHPEKAQFFLLSHSYYDNQPVAEITPVLEKYLAQRLPLLCINPDKEVVRQNGEQIYCAGVIAEQYRMMGGEVIYFGKPYPIVYKACLQTMGHVNKKHVIAIGDSLGNDIAGAAGMGIKSVLVTGGILQNIIGRPDQEGYNEKLANVLEDAPARPDFIIPAFNWE